MYFFLFVVSCLTDAVQQLWIDPFLYPEDTERLGIIDAVFRTTAKCKDQCNYTPTLKKRGVIPYLLTLTTSAGGSQYFGLSPA